MGARAGEGTLIKGVLSGKKAGGGGVQEGPLLHISEVLQIWKVKDGECWSASATKNRTWGVS